MLLYDSGPKVVLRFGLPVRADRRDSVRSVQMMWAGDVWLRRLDSAVRTIGTVDSDGPAFAGWSGCGRSFCRRGRSRGCDFQFLRMLQAGDAVFAVVVVRASVAGLLGEDDFLLEGFQHSSLNHVAAAGVNRVSDVGVEFGSTLVVFDGSIFMQLDSAIVAETGSKLILRAALRAAIRQLAAGHRHEGALHVSDDFQIPNDKALVKGDRTKSLQTIVGIVHEFDSDF